MIKYVALALLLAALASACGSSRKARSEQKKRVTVETKDVMYAKAMSAVKAKKFQKAIPIFEELSPYFSGTLQEDSIAYYSGLCHYKTGDFETSSALFDDFRRRFGRSPFIEDAEYMYALGYYYASPIANRDQTVSLKAVIAINEYMSRYPNSEKRDFLNKCISELENKQDYKAYLNAKSYYTTGRYKSAVVSLKNVLVRFPDSAYGEELLYLTAKSAYLLATNSIESKQKDRFLAMLDDYYNFISAFPESRYRKETDRMADNAKKSLAKKSSQTELRDRKAEAREVKRETKELTREKKEKKEKKTKETK